MELKLFFILVIIRLTLITADKPCENERVYFNESIATETGCICKNNVCFQKCCPFGQVLYMKSCVNATKRINFSVYDSYKYSTIEHNNVVDLFYFKVGFVNCTKIGYDMYIASYYSGEYRLISDGKLYISSPISDPSTIFVSKGHYCIEHLMTDSNNTYLEAVICLPQAEEVPFNFVVPAVCMLVSCVFILLTGAVYLWLPELHNVHGKILVMYLSCLFVAFLFMAILRLLRFYELYTIKFCEIIMFVIYFSLLSAMCWLNVMCYNIWRGFSNKREPRLPKHLIWPMVGRYARYAFGIPTVLTILLISLEYSGLPENKWLPMIRQQGYFLHGHGRMLYMYLPISIICIANIVLFVLTAVKIVKLKSGTGALRSKDSSRSNPQNDRQSLWHCVKLFILMGISWILEVISGLYKTKYWIYTDIYNLLIGLLIFLAFVCTKKTLCRLKQRYRKLKQCTASQSYPSSGITSTNSDLSCHSTETSSENEFRTP